MSRFRRWVVAAVVVVGVVGSGCQPDAVERIRRARTAVYEKDPERALREYRLALDLIEREDAGEARVLQARALKGAADVYYLELRDFRRAVEVYQELIRVCPEAPESLEARIQLADILQVHFYDLRGAISALTGAIDRNAPDSAELTYKVAKLYFELGDYQQATVEAQRVQKRYETSTFVDDAALLEAQALGMMEGRAADATRAFESLVDRFPDSSLVPFALYELGKAKAERGEREAAITFWVRALEKHPEPAMVQNSIARVRRQIVERTPIGVGKSAIAFDRAKTKRVVHRTSLEAVGGSAAEAARETGD